MDIKQTIHLIFIHSVIYVTGNALTCFECSGISSPKFCDSLTLCTSGETCFVQSVITSSGNILYNSGCISGSRCRAKRGTDITLCESCCTGDYCNNQGCGETDTPSNQRGPYCLGCQYLKDPTACNKVKFCYQNEKCSITQDQRLTTSSGTPVYTQSCSRLTDCSSPYTNCCDLDFCNVNYTKPAQVTHGVTQSVTSTVTSYPRTTAPSTKSIPFNAMLRAKCDKLIYEGYFFDTASQMCFRLVKNASTSFNRAEAEGECQKHGARLAAFHNSKELDAIYYEIFSRRANDTSYWIGAREHVSGSYDYWWPGGRHVEFADWVRLYRGQPDSPMVANEHCVYLNYKDKYRWYDDSCTAKKTGYICEIGANILGDKRSECRKHIFDGYRLSGDICLKVHADTSGNTYTRAEADNACRRESGNLITIDTKSKFDAVLREIFIHHANATDYWIGAEANPQNTGVFVWPTGSVVGQYTNWGGLSYSHLNRSQPDTTLYDVTDQRCVYMDFVHNYSWFDIDCNRKLGGYICQHHEKNDIEMSCRRLLSQGYWYDRSSNMCFALRYNMSVTRAEAAGRCRSEGSELLSMTSQNALNTVLQQIFFQRQNATDYWLDGIYDDNAGTFVWQTSNQPFSYTHWYHAQPKSCVIMDFRDRYKWAPTPCNWKMQGFICRLDMH